MVYYFDNDFVVLFDYNAIYKQLQNISMII